MAQSFDLSDLPLINVDIGEAITRSEATGQELPAVCYDPNNAFDYLENTATGEILVVTDNNLLWFV